MLQQLVSQHAGQYQVSLWDKGGNYMMQVHKGDALIFERQVDDRRQYADLYGRLTEVLAEAGVA